MARTNRAKDMPVNIRMRIDPDAVPPPKRTDDESLTITSLLWSLWRRKKLFGVAAAAGLVLLLAMLAMMRPLYTSEATLEMNFNRDEVVSTTVSRQLASMDPGALVNGAAQSISSRANALRVVRRLGLDKQPQFERRSLLSTIFGGLRSLFGIAQTSPAAEELAVNELLQNVKVTYKSHLYLIGVSYAARDPESAAHLANAFAIEYLRGERLKEMTNQRALAQSELLSVSEKLGALHPRRAQIEDRVKRFDEEIQKVSTSPPEPKNFLLGGQYLTLAEPIWTPTSQKKPAMFIVGLGIVLILAALAALVIDRVQKSAYGSHPYIRWLAGLDRTPT